MRSVRSARERVDWMRLQPGLYLSMLIARMVVADQADGQFFGGFTVDFLAEGQTFHDAVAARH